MKTIFIILVLFLLFHVVSRIIGRLLENDKGEAFLILAMVLLLFVFFIFFILSIGSCLSNIGDTPSYDPYDDAFRL